MLRPPAPTSSAVPLAWAYAAVVVYASLYPFAGWRWPPGHSAGSLLLLAWPPWRDPFDLWANLLGYLPLGLLAALAIERPGRRWITVGALVVAGTLVLSYLCEIVQHFLPGRHPSLKDCLMNAAGAAVGAAVAALVHAAGAARAWSAMRERWFVPRSGGALALLALWPLALLVPTPWPLGLGRIGERLRDEAILVLDGVPWAAPLHDALVASRDEVVAVAARPLSEALVSALGLLAPCMVAYSVAHPGWRRALLAIGATTLAIAAMTLSTLLNFGPQHALAWIGPVAMPALVAAGLLGIAMAPLPRRVAAGIGLLALAGSVVLVAQGPGNPYFALNLRAWEQGRFVHFHGMVQWIAWLWPYLAMVWLLSVLARRD